MIIVVNIYFIIAPMAKEFSHLGITLPEEVVAVSKTNKRVKSLFDTLTALDKIAQWAHKEKNIRIGLLQDIVRQWITASQWEAIDSVIENLSRNIDIVMAAEIADEWGFYEDKWFTYQQNSEQITTETPIDYKPIEISDRFGVLGRSELYFVNKPWMNQQTIHYQPFIERSDEDASIEFAKEYYTYCCNPTVYPWSTIKDEDITDQEWFPITGWVLEHMEKKTGKKFSDLKIYKFFEQVEGYWISREYFMPTHGLLCQMALMCSLATAPAYLAGWHLWDPYKNTEQFAYYTQFLIQNNANVIPNRQWLIKTLQILITILKNKKDHWSRLFQQEISVDELFPLMKEQDVWPFELYESLLRDQLCLVTNITEGDTIWFKLTGTWMIFLYMCCPKI